MNSICTESPSSQQVSRPCRTILRDSLRFPFYAVTRYVFLNRLDVLFMGDHPVEQVLHARTRSLREYAWRKELLRPTDPVCTPPKKNRSPCMDFYTRSKRFSVDVPKMLNLDIFVWLSIGQIYPLACMPVVVYACQLGGAQTCMRVASESRSWLGRFSNYSCAAPVWPHAWAPRWPSCVLDCLPYPNSKYHCLVLVYCSCPWMSADFF
jgi:hypothetical protein